MSRRASLLTLAIAVLVGSALRLTWIGTDPLWLDEGFSFMFARLGWTELWLDLGKLDHNTPLYYSLLKLWSGALGWDETSMRSLSALASIATIPIAYGLGLSSSSGDRARSIAAGAAVLVAVNPVSVWSGQEVRSYALLSLVLAITFWCVVRIMRGRDESVGIWIALAPLMAVACWLHNLATLATLSIGATLFLWALCQTERRTQRVRRSLEVGAGIVALWLPALYYVLTQTQKMSDGYWVRPVKVRDALEMYVWNLDARLPMERVWVGLICVLCAVGAASLARRHKAPFVAILLGGSLVVPAALQIAWSVWAVPLLIPRTLSWMVVPMAVLVAVACDSLPTRRLRATALLALSAVYLAGSVGYARQMHGRDWRGLVARLAEQSSPGDLVVLTPGRFEVPYAYYAWREGLDLPVVVLPDLVPATPEYTGPRRLAGCAAPQGAPPTVQSPACPISSWDGAVWLIAAARRGEGFEDAIAAAAHDGRRRERYDEWGSFLRVSRYTSD